MEHLRSIGIFVRAVELQSFAAAAGALALTPSAVSKAVAGLETSLGVRLLTRAARGVTLTDEGARFYARCRTIVSELEAAEREASGSRGAARGRLRVALHTGLAQGRILAHLPRFLELHPAVQLEVLLAPGSRSLEAEGIDVGVFIGEPIEKNLVARRIAEIQFVTCASRRYLEAHGAPRSPSDLPEHNCLVYSRPNGRPYDEWTFTQGDETQVVKVRGNYGANEGPVLRDAAMASVGITRIFDIADASVFAGGMLVPLLTEWQGAGPPVQIMYQRSGRTAPKIRAFTGFVASLFEDHKPSIPKSGRKERWPMYRA